MSVGSEARGAASPGSELAGRGSALAAGLTAAVVAGVAGAVLLAAGAVLPIVSDAAPPAFASGPLLVALAVLPAVLTVLFVLRGRPTAAAGVLMGAAALVPGRVLLDLQVFVDSSASTRPERFIPTSLAPLDPAAGLWLLLAGHLVTLVAGLLAVWAVKASSEGLDDPIGQLGGDGTAGQPAGEAADESGGSGAIGSGAVRGGVVAVPAGARSTANQRWFVGTLGIAALAVVGVLMAPLGSTDPYLLARPAVESPLFTLLGYVVLAISVPAAAVFAVTAASRGVTRGCLLGVAAALLAVELPNLLAGFLGDDLAPAPGPIVALVAVAGLAAVALSPAGRESSEQAGEPGAPQREPGMPSEYRLHLVAGVLAILAGIAAWLAGQSVHVISAGGVLGTDSFTKRMLLPAGVLVALLGVALLVRQSAPVVRPALSVAWIVIPLTGTGSLDTVVAATKVNGVQTGSGPVWTSVAMFLAAVAAGACVVAGAVDRDESGVGDQRQSGPSVFGYAPLVAAAALAIGAFALPTVRASGYAGADLAGNFRTSSYGLLLALLAVLVAVVLATRSRPKRAGALLLGTACLPAMHALELPLTGGRAADAAAGSGTWLSLACAGALVIGAGAMFARVRTR